MSTSTDQGSADGAYHHGNLREALLGLAVETLSDSGVEQLSLRAMARELDVSHAAPLRHFKTKADLLNAIAVEGVKSLLAATSAAAADQPSGVRRLRHMALAYVDWAREHAAFHRVIRNPEVMRHATAPLHEMLAEFASLQRREISAAQGQGWRADADADVLFVHLVSLTAGTAIVATDAMYQAPMGAATSREALTASLDLFLSDRSSS
ncbi:TetR/AcrR family transcriptional regulator [Euzebya tangerina]|uniref:TetR/AcrR family transcriptional regulator n=1 Tax=Euzebya tangerina TaxID=591198 RepID=UPI000E323410|nr:TetR family transcriptional regulator [Euzebya tangerina]